VLTDRAVHALEAIAGLGEGAVQDIRVYQPYTDIVDFSHAMVQGLRPNARQLVETAPLGYCIGNDCSPMTVVDEAAFADAGGHVVGTTGEGRVSVGELGLGKGLVRIVGGALPTPTEEHDHRYGLRNYAMTYTGLFIMENAIVHDAPGLGIDAREKDRRLVGAGVTGPWWPPVAPLLLALLALAAALRRSVIEAR
jgi:hypothetical protein